MKKKKKKTTWGALIIALVITIMFMVLYNLKGRARSQVERDPRRANFEFLELIEVKAYDIRFQFCQRYFPPPPSDKVVIAAIDDRAVGEYQWPFPRDKWSIFLKRMDEYGAEVVAFDVVFADEGEYQGLSFLRDVLNKYLMLGLDQPPDAVSKIRNRQVKDYIRKVGRFAGYIEKKEKEADTDRVLAETLKDKDNVVLGWYSYRSRSEAERFDAVDNTDEVKLLMPSTLPFMSRRGWDMKKFYQRTWPVRAYGLQTNIPIISRAASKFGFFTATPDPIDGTIRKTPLITVYSEDPQNASHENTHIYPSLSLATVSAWYDRKPKVIPGDLGLKVKMGDKVIPTDMYGRILINWMGPQQSFPYVSVYDVITGFQNQEDADFKIENPRDFFKGKIVLIGSTSIGAHDMRTTPFGTSPGVEMHANIISNIIDDDFLIHKEWFALLDYLFLLVIGVLFGLLLPRLSPITGGLIAFLLFAGYLGTNLYFFAVEQYSFTLVYPLAEILTIYIAVTIYRYATEEKEKRFIKNAFEHYLSPNVIHQLMDDPDMLNLGGERKVLTAFFSDIQGFSTISESMQADELVHFLNEYLTEMCDIILEYDGTIDKFEGDAIIAFFGAPIYFEDHAVRACLCAVDIQERMKELRKKWTEEGRPEIHMRIGLNTGDMVVGNMGSADRMDYTMMGDSVNLAARLEAAAKQYRIYTMISEFTYEKAKEHIEVRELDLTRVVGKEEPVKVYEVLGKKGEVSPEKLKVAELYQEGLELYKQRYWMDAVVKFMAAIELDPRDGPSHVFLARCEEFNENPPAAGWDGVYTMTEK
ncbi:MAG: adenylate/guanylate cyclase domain-containing protein [bacterium]